MMRAQVINGVTKPSHPRAGFIGGPLDMLGDIELDEAMKKCTPEKRRELIKFKRDLALTNLLAILALSGAIAAGVASGYIVEKNKENNQNTDKTVLIQDEK